MLGTLSALPAASTALVVSADSQSLLRFRGTSAAAGEVVMLAASFQVEQLLASDVSAVDRSIGGGPEQNHLWAADAGCTLSVTELSSRRPTRARRLACLLQACQYNGLRCRFLVVSKFQRTPLLISRRDPLARILTHGAEALKHTIRVPPESDRGGLPAQIIAELRAYITLTLRHPDRISVVSTAAAESCQGTALDASKLALTESIPAAQQLAVVFCTTDFWNRLRDAAAFSSLRHLSLSGGPELFSPSLIHDLSKSCVTHLHLCCDQPGLTGVKADVGGELLTTLEDLGTEDLPQSFGAALGGALVLARLKHLRVQARDFTWVADFLRSAATPPLQVSFRRRNGNGENLQDAQDAAESRNCNVCVQEAVAL